MGTVFHKFWKHGTDHIQRVRPHPHRSELWRYIHQTCQKDLFQLLHICQQENNEET